MTQKRRSSTPASRRGAPRRARRSGKPWPLLFAALAALLLLIGGVLTALWSWGNAVAGPSQQMSVQLPQGDRAQLCRSLQQQGVVAKPALLAAYWAVFQRSVQVDPGVHLLPPQQSPRQLLQLLGRRSNRKRVSVSVPEGWNLFQIAERLEKQGVTARLELLRQALTGKLARQLGVQADSLEGYLFPDTYELYLNSSAQAVLERMVKRAQQYHQVLISEHATQVDALHSEFSFGLHQVIVFASMLEREAANPAEYPKIASVFFNRLRDESFRPRGMLQSDPTAGYGCLLQPSLPSCAGYSGRITPALLRDAQNPYNTYRRAGLPPGPIGNPGAAALRAVLQPADTPFLFFVADGHGRHVFTRTLAEHEAAIAGQ